MKIKFIIIEMLIQIEKYICNNDNKKTNKLYHKKKKIIIKQQKID